MRFGTSCGATREEDAANAEKLLNNPKERAEHLMLLDLGRNDVVRAAEEAVRFANETPGNLRS